MTAAELLTPPDPNADRPLSIKLLGVLSLIIGVLGTVGCGGYTILAGLSVRAAGGLQVSPEKVVPYDAGMLNTAIAFAVVDLIVSAGLVLAALAAMRLRPWGRRWAVWLSAITLVVAVAKAGIALGVHRQQWVDVRKAELAALTAEQRQNVPADIEQQIETMSYRSPLISLALQGLVPLLVVVFWTRKPVRDAFEPAAAS
jgi:hypothetical protein